MFVQLSVEDCNYLLSLIQEMDSDTKFTERQRGYTVPKLERIKLDPRSARLAYQDVDYLLELIEDSGDLDYEDTLQQASMTLAAVLEIQSLQNQRFEEQKDIETQRSERKAKRRPGQALAEHFQHVS